MGGYRNGSGRAKSGYFRGIYCGSSYELVWLIYQLDHNKKVERFSNKLEKDGVVYYPDFLQDDQIIELKGFEKQESVDKKIEVARSFGFNVVLLRKEDLQKEFEWVKNNYTYDKVWELYDSYKPKYEYTCSTCHINFMKDKMSKYDRQFCGRKCALLWWSGKKRNT